MGYYLNGKEHILANGKEWVTSKYGYRVDPVTGKPGTYHGGIDLVDGKSWGTVAVLAFAAGVVRQVVRDVTWSFAVTKSIAGVASALYNGNYVVIEHAGGFTTTYKHMKTGSILVKVGDKVLKGAPIGTMGTTGYSTGNHVHFEVALNGTRTDPEQYLLGKKVFPAVALQRPSVAEVHAAIDTLSRVGIINTAAYWYSSYPMLADLDFLLVKSALVVKKVGALSPTVDKALDDMVAAGIISSPTYWKQNYTRVPFLEDLLKRLGGSV